MAINGREYEFGDITVIVGGRDIQGLRGINYKTSADREALYGKGRKPIAIQTGNKSFEGSIVVTQSELDAMNQAAGGSILDLAVDIEVTYGTTPDPIKTDRIEGVRFSEFENSFNQGDKFQEITIPFIAVNILNNI